jgi:hypothetical protein
LDRVVLGITGGIAAMSPLSDGLPGQEDIAVDVV